MISIEKNIKFTAVSLDKQPHNDIVFNFRFPYLKIKECQAHFHQQFLNKLLWTMLKKVKGSYLLTDMRYDSYLERYMKEVVPYKNDYEIRKADEGWYILKKE